MKRVYISIVALVLMLFMTSSELMAQTRVRFRRGTNSATLTGRLGVGSARSYVLGASAGQTLTATLSSGNGRVDFTQGNVHDTQYSRVLEYDGDVILTIDNHGSPTNYTLTISIQ